MLAPDLRATIGPSQFRGGVLIELKHAFTHEASANVWHFGLGCHCAGGAGSGRECWNIETVAQMFGESIRLRVRELAVLIGWLQSFAKKSSALCVPLFVTTAIEEYQLLFG